MSEDVPDARLEADVLSLTITVQPEDEVGAAPGLLLQMLADTGLHHSTRSEQTRLHRYKGRTLVVRRHYPQNVWV